MSSPAAPPFRARFDCLWCGSPWATRGAGDLEGWAQLCPACLGKAGSNSFLRSRLRSAIEARAAAGALTTSSDGRPSRVSAASADPPATGRLPRRPGTGRGPRTPGTGRGPRTPPPAFPDDWFLRRGPFGRGAVHDTAWEAELDMVTRWLDGQPLAGRIEEPAAGVGFFSPLLADRGELFASDPDGPALDGARDRLVAHRLMAHLHVADPWVVPPRPDTPAGPGPAADAVVAAFLLGRVRGPGLDTAAASFRARLRAGGRLAVIELRNDPDGGPPPGIAWTWHPFELVEAALARAGFTRIEHATTGRFFVLISAEAA
jgi:hypothetical protein